MFDTETSGKHSATAQIVQIGAVVVDARRLEIIPGTEFCLMIKPLYGEECAKAGLEELGDGAINIHGKTHEMLAEHGVTLQTGMENFIEYVNSHNPAKTKWKAPIAGGYNIINYDIPILNRDLIRTGLEYPFHPIYMTDVMQMMWGLFENDKNVTSLSMDNLVRRYMGYKDKGATHDALSDAVAAAEVFCKTMRLMRKVASKTVFANCFAD